MAHSMKKPWEHEFVTDWDRKKASDAQCGLCAQRCGDVRGLYHHLYNVHRIGSNPHNGEDL